MAGLVSACLSASRKVMLLRGVDSLKFLHGTVTVDILKHHKKGLFATMLNAQGRILADVFIYPSTGPDNEPHFFVDCDATLIDTLIQHLNRFKLRSKVTITPPDEELNVWQMWDPNGTLDLSATDSVNAKSKFLDERTPMGAIRMLLPANAKPAAPEVPALQYHAYRIMNALPEGVTDLPFSKGFPFESNMDYMRGVHFDKGCYLGQEPTARTFFRGATRKRILPIQFAVDQPPSVNKITLDTTFPISIPAGTSLLQANDKKSIGSTSTVVHNIALAMVRLPEKEEDMKQLDDLIVDFPEKSLRAKVIKPSWWDTRGVGKK